MSFHIVIPARFGSTRFPGKPLALIHGKPMIVHVLEAAQKISCDSITVATDDERIAQAVIQSGGQVVMTSSAHESGTDRLAEVAAKLGWDDNALVVNIQGDEPEVDSDLISKLVDCAFSNPNAAVATVITPITSLDQKQNPNIVKAVQGSGDEVLYFSRAPIPFNRDINSDFSNCYRHLGLYAYRVGALKRFAQAEVAKIESLEKLEQLRFMAMGDKIVATVFTGDLAPGIDTPADLVAYEKRVKIL